VPAVVILIFYVYIYISIYIYVEIVIIFTRESSYCFYGVLAIAIPFVRLSVCRRGGSVKNGAR